MREAVRSATRTSPHHFYQRGKKELSVKSATGSSFIKQLAIPEKRRKYCLCAESSPLLAKTILNPSFTRGSKT
jgi:hypothetical protein